MRIVRLYKGLTAAGYARFVESRRPGYCGPQDMATIYAEPTLVGLATDTTYLVSFEVDMDSFVHRPEIGDSCLIEPIEHPHLYSSNWTAASSATCDDEPVPYHGEALAEWRLEATIHGQDEWHALWDRTPRRHPV